MSEAARTSFSVTYMTSLTHPRGGVLLSIREGSNDAIDYFESLVDACHNNHLREGDILVVDNAKIHGAANNNNNSSSSSDNNNNNDIIIIHILSVV